MENAELILSKIKNLILPSLNELGIELYDIEYKRESTGWVLRLYIDKELKVNIGDCETVSKCVSSLLDSNDLLDEGYHLEVSSPGLDRPLKTEKDFLRCKGLEVKIFTHAPISGAGFTHKNFYGKIKDVINDKVVLDMSGSGTTPSPFILEIPVCEILRAKLDIKFK
ncbi:MAG: ribosome maturation factor RimP [Candidatus Firestonebacteria bacterium]